MSFIDNFNSLERYFLIYLISINLTTFLIFGFDKIRASAHKWRVPEIHLMFLTLIGGGVGGIIGMVVFKHKLSKVIFSIGVPIMIVLNTIMIIFITNKLK